MIHSEIPAPIDRKAVELLRLLGRGTPAGLSLAELSRRLRMGSGTLQNLIQRLRGKGYRFAAPGDGGWSLIERPDHLTPEEVLSGLATRSLGRPFHSFRKVTSTNDVAFEMARQGAPEGTVVVAETQTQGRGRRGRAWAGTPGRGLAFSVILRPRLPSDELPLLTLAASVAVAESLQDLGLSPEIKWPNDVMISGRKVCGILTEMQAEQDRLDLVVLGIGLNVNQERDDFPENLRDRAESLKTCRGRSYPRAGLLQAVLLHLEETLERVKRREGSRVLSVWRRFAALPGRQVRVSQVGRTFFAQALHVDEKGALWVRNDLGMVERLTAGDVEYLRMGSRVPVRRVSGRMVHPKGRKKGH